MEFMGKIWRRQGGLSKMYQKLGKDRKNGIFSIVCGP